MVVVSLTECPYQLRGDLSKWLIEINTGVYVGNINARVRELLWERICKNIKTGRATMVYSTTGEQKMDFKVHNTTWKPVDYEGLTLIKRPLPTAQVSSSLPENFSKAAQRQLHRKALMAEARRNQNSKYVVIDTETTGLSATNDEILEIAGIKVENGEIIGEYEHMIKICGSIPEKAKALTGITEEECKASGIPLKEAIEELVEFIEALPLVMHNATFDTNFLRAACKRNKIDIIKNRTIDTLQLSREKLNRSVRLKLEDVASDLGIEVVESHRAMSDCKTTMQIYEKLKKR